MERLSTLRWQSVGRKALLYLLPLHAHAGANGAADA